MLVSNEYQSFMDLLEFPEAAAGTFRRVEIKLLQTNSAPAFYQFVEDFMEKEIPFINIQPKLDSIAGRLQINPFTLHMHFYLSCCRRLEKKYKAKGFPYEIFKNSITDLRYKLYECHDVFGVWGNATATWPERFFNLTRFALGRLQYETVPYRLDCYDKKGVNVKKGDTVINIHIPSAGPLSEELRMDSYKQAYEFFEAEQKDGLLVFVCLSWLLYPPHREFLPGNSNILRFMDDFDIIDSYDEETFSNSWRVFGKYHQLPPAELPEDSSLRRAYKERLLNGGKTGWGYGVIVFNSDGIVK